MHAVSTVHEELTEKVKEEKIQKSKWWVEQFTNIRMVIVISYRLFHGSKELYIFYMRKATNSIIPHLN